MDITPILQANNENLKSVEISLLGQIEKFKEELVKTRAKIAHNTELLEILSRAEDTNETTTDTE
ncbi:MAG: hypothetical protein WC965_02160 [Thiohalomonadaceae bacterium]